MLHRSRLPFTASDLAILVMLHLHLQLLGGERVLPRNHALHDNDSQLRSKINSFKHED